MTVSREAGSQLMRTVREATIKVLGHDLVKDNAEALLMNAVIKAYGKSAAGFVYGSPSRARSTLHPPDVVLCHPEVGLLIIEAKSHTIEEIQGCEAGSIMIRYQGRIKPTNVIRQAEKQMYAIKNDIVKLVRDPRKEPLINCMVAFPFISESDWVRKGYDKAHPSTQLLFKEHVDDPKRLQKRVAQLVKDMLRESRKSQPLDEAQLETIFQIFGNSDVINEKRPPRQHVERQKLGYLIDEMVALDKYLSEEQKEFSSLKIGAYPRIIRGVAGSGKSIVLANMVARHLHRKLKTFDEGNTLDGLVNVAVTCFNQALVPFLRKKIRTAYREQTMNEDIPSSILLITHLNELIWKLKTERGWPIDYIRVSDVPEAAERARLYREQIAAFAAEQPDLYRNVCFDVMFVDEGQDFDPEEYRLLLDLIKPTTSGEKPLIIFYDDAQNLYGRPRPVWQEIGINVSVGDRTRVMRECFRNTRQVIELAFNVLLGSQAPAEMRVQMRTYADVPYLKSQNLIEELDSHFHVSFTEREGRKPEIYEAPTRQAEIDWLTGEVCRLIKQEEVRPEDILILFFRPSEFDYRQLKDRISGSLAGQTIQFIEPFGKSDDKKEYIFKENCLTVSTVYGAKGYDAPIVFLAGVDAFSTDREGRAAFYVGATRSKLILYLSGICSNTPTLLHEAQRVLQVI